MATRTLGGGFPGVMIDRILASDAGLANGAPNVLLVVPAQVTDGICPVPDTIHIDAESCKRLGEAMAAKVRECF